MATNTTSIEILAGEFEHAKQQLKQTLNGLWSSKVESHYISLNFGGKEYCLKVNTQQPQVLYCAEDHRTVLIPFLKATLDDFFAGKIPAGQEYFHDIDHDQRIENTKTGNYVFPGGTPQERLAKEPPKVFVVKPSVVEATAKVEKPSLIGFFKRKVEQKQVTPDVKPDGTKLDPK